MIRAYRDSDYSMIKKWWMDYNEPAPMEGAMVTNGTFILELNNVPALCLSTFLTQSKEIAYVAGFIKNPEFRSVSLESEAQKLWDHNFKFAKDNGYKRVICFSVVEKLSKKYERFGMRRTYNTLSSFVREI